MLRLVSYGLDHHWRQPQPVGGEVRGLTVFGLGDTFLWDELISSRPLITAKGCLPRCQRTSTASSTLSDTACTHHCTLLDQSSPSTTSHGRCGASSIQGSTKCPGLIADPQSDIHHSQRSNIIRHPLPVLPSYNGKHVAYNVYRGDQRLGSLGGG